MLKRMFTRLIRPIHTITVIIIDMSKWNDCQPIKASKVFAWVVQGNICTVKIHTYAHYIIIIHMLKSDRPVRL